MTVSAPGQACLPGEIQGNGIIWAPVAEPRMWGKWKRRGRRDPRCAGETVRTVRTQPPDGGGGGAKGCARVGRGANPWNLGPLAAG